MRAAALVGVLALGATMTACRRDVEPGTIVAMERAALDRWSKGDPRGYVEIMEADVTYFDPNLEHRVDGRGAMERLLDPLAGKIKIDRYEMVNPRVQQDGNVAVLTFNLVNYVHGRDGTETVLNRWNSTEVYRRHGGSWKLAHSHWSYVRPQPAQRTPAS